MNAPPHPRLQLFVGSVLTYYAQLIVSVFQNVTVNYNPHTGVFWFVLTRDRGMIENKYVETLEDLDAIPRMAQIGWIEGNPTEPLLFLFFNERGVYTKGMPHTVPTASCNVHQAKEAAQTLFNYLTTGSFTGGMQYGVMRSMRDKIVEPLKNPSVDLMQGLRARMAERAKEVFAPTPRFENEVFHNFNVSKRIKNILLAHRLYYIDAVRRCTECDLLALPGIGPKSIEQIKAALAEHELKLKVKRKKK